MLEADFPRPFDAKVRFVDRYTFWDVILRLGGPAALGWSVSDGRGALIGLVVGVVLVEVAPGGKTLDTHLLDGIGSFLRPVQVSAPAFKQVRHDVAVLRDGTLVGLVKVTPHRLEHLSESEKRANWGAVHDFIKGLDSRVEVHSRQRTTSLSEQPGPEDAATVTDHFVVVRVGSGENRKQRLDARCSKIRDALSAADLSATRLTGDSFRKGLNQLYLGEIQLFHSHYEPRYGEKPVHQVKYVSRFPERLNLGWIADILNLETPGTINVVQAAYPINQYQRNRMDQVINQLEMELNASEQPVRQTDLRQQHQDLEDLVEIEGRGEALVNYGVYIIACGSSPREADETMQKVESHLGSKRVELDGFHGRMHRAAKQESAFHTRYLTETIVVPGRAAAAGYPFAAATTLEDNGVLVGRDTRDGNPVLLDRFSWEAGHINVSGKTGSGKSFWTGLMLLRSAQVFDDLEIFVLDGKKRDYKGVAEALDGETVILDDTDLENVEAGDVVRYTVDDPSRDNAELLVDAVQHIYREAAQTESRTLVVIDEVHRILTRGEEVNEEGVRMVSRLIRESRVRNISVTLISQNVDEFSRSNEGRNILRNVDAALLFKQQDVETEVEDFYGLSESEVDALYKLRTGTKLPYSQAIIRGPLNTVLDIEASEEESRIIENNTTAAGPGAVSDTVEPSRDAAADGGSHRADTGDVRGREEEQGVNGS